MVIAIDGPAGAGKSSVAGAVARELGFTYLDSGAMYRSVALVAMRDGRPPAEIAPSLKIELSADRVRLNGEDVTAAIRTPQVSEAASRAAADPSVRRAMVTTQRRLLSVGDWVVEGRDIGTVVAPDAPVKMYLTASEEVRAGRRNAETTVEAVPVDVTRDEIARRDRLDSTRAVAPLSRAADAIEVDTTTLTQQQVVDAVLAQVRRVMEPATAPGVMHRPTTGRVSGDLAH
jgi:cytidylate kinase